MTVATKCPACSTGKQIELEMTTKAGNVLTLRSCMRCEARSWFVDGKPVGRDELLRATSANSEFELRQPPPRAPRTERR